MGGILLPASAPHSSCFLGIILRLSNKEIKDYFLMHSFLFLFEQNLPF